MNKQEHLEKHVDGLEDWSGRVENCLASDAKEITSLKERIEALEAQAHRVTELEARMETAALDREHIHDELEAGTPGLIVDIVDTQAHKRIDELEADNAHLRHELVLLTRGAIEVHPSGWSGVHEAMKGRVNKQVKPPTTHEYKLGAEQFAPSCGTCKLRVKCRLGFSVSDKGYCRCWFPKEQTQTVTGVSHFKSSPEPTSPETGTSADVESTPTAKPVRYDRNGTVLHVGDEVELLRRGPHTIWRILAFQESQVYQLYCQGSEPTTEYTQMLGCKEVILWKQAKEAE